MSQRLTRVQAVAMATILVKLVLFVRMIWQTVGNQDYEIAEKAELGADLMQEIDGIVNSL